MTNAIATKMASIVAMTPVAAPSTFEHAAFFIDTCGHTYDTKFRSAGPSVVQMLNDVKPTSQGVVRALLDAVCICDEKAQEMNLADHTWDEEYTGPSSLHTYYTYSPVDADATTFKDLAQQKGLSLEVGTDGEFLEQVNAQLIALANAAEYMHVQQIVRKIVGA